MATLDVIVLGVVLLFTLIGFLRGLLRKLAGLGALVGACIGVGYVARPATRYLVDNWEGANWLLVYVVCAVLGWIVLYILLRVILGYIAGALGSNEKGKPRPWNRKLGAAFGGLEGLLICWLVVMLLCAVPEDVFAKYLPALNEELQGSLFAKATRTTTPSALAKLEPLIDDLKAVARKPETLEKLAQEAPVEELLENDKVDSIVKDEELTDHLREGRVERFLEDRKVGQALTDPEVLRILRSPALRRALSEAAQEARDSDE